MILSMLSADGNCVNNAQLLAEHRGRRVTLPPASAVVSLLLHVDRRSLHFGSLPEQHWLVSFQSAHLWVLYDSSDRHDHFA